MSVLRRFPARGRAAFGLPLLFWALVAWAQQAPEPASGFAPKPVVAGTRFMVAAAHPLAVDAGFEVLERGGTAMDAAVAVQFMLGLVEPQSSGVGGGSFILHYSAADGRVRAYDGRETAPAAAAPMRFTGLDGLPLPFTAALLSGNSVGVPGTVAALELAHRNHGRRPWAELLVPAIERAEAGFSISPRLHVLLEQDPWLRRDPFAASRFYGADGQARAEGATVRNPEYAATLRGIAAAGAVALRKGPIAEDIVAAVRNNPNGAGDMTLADLEGYRAKERDPVCGAFRTRRVCTMGPPSGGGVTLLQILGLLAGLPPTDYTRDPLAAVHVFAEAGRLAYADRDRFLADPDFVPVPVAGLLAPDYLASRRSLISPAASMGPAEAGRPAGAQLSLAEGWTLDLPSTSHFSIVDAEGNAVAVTSSIEFAFGNHRFVRGFLLNNQLTDFAFVPGADGRPVANRVEGGKRPRSSMAPAFVFAPDGRLALVAGSPGGHSIINYVAATIVAVTDWGMTLEEALAMPRFGSRNGPTELEAGTSAASLEEALRKRGHAVRVGAMTSGVHAVMRAGDRWLGGADPRRDGTARGK